MAGQLDALPRGQIGEDLFPSLGDLSLHSGDFLVEIDADRMGVPVFGQFFELALQFRDRLLEIELMFHRGKD